MASFCCVVPTSLCNCCIIRTRCLVNLTLCYTPPPDLPCFCNHATQQYIFDKILGFHLQGNKDPAWQAPGSLVTTTSTSIPWAHVLRDLTLLAHHGNAKPVLRQGFLPSNHPTITHCTANLLDRSEAEPFPNYLITCHSQHAIARYLPTTNSIMAHDSADYAFHLTKRPRTKTAQMPLLITRYHFGL